MFKYPALSVKRLILALVLSSIVPVTLFISCNNSSSPPSLPARIVNGKALSLKYCVSCHEWPDPALIDRQSWINGVLPAMGKNLGIDAFMGGYYINKNSVISLNDWQQIVTYYANMAPLTLPIPKPSVAPLNDNAIFSIVTPKKVVKTMPAMTTMLSFDTLDHKLYSGNALNDFYEWDARLNSKLVYHFPSPVTGTTFMKMENGTTTAIVTCIGDLAPRNSKKGKVFALDLTSGLKKTGPVLLTDSLPRPVATVAADFNKDGLMDYVTCSFGHDSGGLYYMEQKPDHSFKKNVISNIAGGEQLITGDFNHDGWPDVICLFAQADEGIRMFLNDRKGGFITKTLLRFPPVYGSSSFQLVDFNHDGKPDILYTCGDNSDYSKVLKPYHGVYIFTNQGDWKFKQTYFYQINGCTKAIARDFEHNGHLSIAAIAFFADFKFHPKEGFTYLDQINPDHYVAHQVSVDNYGRWLEMEVADIDGDGYDDIILGNFSTQGRGLVNQPGLAPKWDMFTPLILLKNNSGKKK